MLTEIIKIGPPVPGGPWDHLRIPGEPLWWRSEGRYPQSAVLQRITIRRALWAIVVRLVAYLSLVTVTIWSFAWWTENPTIDNTCVRPPVGRSVEYRGFDGAWLINGHVIGYTPAEDDGCLSLDPL